MIMTVLLSELVVLVHWMMLIKCFKFDIQFLLHSALLFQCLLQDVTYVCLCTIPSVLPLCFFTKSSCYKYEAE